MTNSDKGHYAAKHPDNAKVDERIAQAIKDRSKNEMLSCSAASAITKEISVSMADVGRTADLLEVRIHKCLLGLFGMGPDVKKKPLIEPAKEIRPELEKAIKTNLVDGRLTCQTALNIAQRLGVTRRSVTEACEALKIKISQCQLGAF